MENFIDQVIPNVKPKFVLATGDLTDAFASFKRFSSQSIDEWKIYQNILKSRGLHKLKDYWIDIRGNHDCFDVLNLNDKHNYFAKYSVTKEYNFTRKYQQDALSVGIVAVDAW